MNNTTNGLYNLISDITAPCQLLTKNENTKQILDAYNNWNKQYNYTLSNKALDEFFRLSADYERAIGVTAFLLGYQHGCLLNSQIKSSTFVSDALDKIMFQI